MANTYKVLGQNNPTAVTLTALYTVPAATNTFVAALYISNLSSTQATFRVSIAINGAVDTNAQYLYRDISISGNDTFKDDVGYALQVGDVIRVYASTANLAFNLFGQERT